MPNVPDIASIGALLGDPTRSAMLAALMDGRALTATELAMEGGVTPPTASSHLAKLLAGRLISVAKQGRHRYFRIAGPDVASVIESLSTLTVRAGGPVVRTGPRDDAMRRARVCYDHLAGEAGVRLFDSLRSKDYLDGNSAEPRLTNAGWRWLRVIGVDVDELLARRRPLCLACLDWSERREHLAGAVGAAILERLVTLRMARRQRNSRALALLPRAEYFLEHLKLR
ncbi:MAG: winged helix-turn-helix domain-containing protein [Gemmatimonadota bacterium]|nr:winged helix-turn-helix domain-containing protein [Gemmatimonadota bacterium]